MIGSKTKAGRLAVAAGLLAATCAGLAGAPAALAAGEPLWIRKIGTVGGVDSAWGVAADPAGNVLLTGYTGGSLGGRNRGQWDAWVAKLDPEGGVGWIRQLGTNQIDKAWGVATDAAGNVFVTGETWGSLGGRNRGGNDAWVAKLDAGGEVAWTRQLGTTTWDEAFGVATDLAGNIFVIGYTYGSLGGRNRGSEDAWVAKLDAAGEVLWKRQLGTPEADYAKGLATDPAGSVVVTGYTWGGSLGGRNRGARDAWVAKLDADGNVRWKRQLGTTANDGGSSVVTDPAGNVFVTGYTLGPLGGHYGGEVDAWVAKLDDAGNVEWKRQFATSQNDEACAVGTGAAGNVLLAGFHYGAGGYDTWLAKLGPDGDVVWKHQLGTNVVLNGGCPVASDAAGNVLFAGRTLRGQNDAWVAKFAPID